MRQPIQDANAGATLEKQPAQQHAARTAEISVHQRNSAQKKLQQFDAMESTLAQAISPYLEKEAENKNKARYMKAYLEAGTKKGNEEWLRDNKRTGVSAAVFGGQTPEYKGRLAALAKAASDELYVEQAAFIEDTGGDLSATEYAEHSSTVAKEFLEGNFTEAPDAAVAFMRSWQERSNQLATQQSKLYAVRQQEGARKDFKEGWQSTHSAAKTLSVHNPEAGEQLLNDMYDFSKLKTNMEYPAWSSATIEETLATLGMGDTSLIATFRGSALYNDMNTKQIKAYSAAITKLDGNNADEIKTTNNTLEFALQAAKTPSEVDRAFEAHKNTILNVSAKNTFTAQHMSNISGADVFRGKMGETYLKQREVERKERTTRSLAELKFDNQQYDYEISRMVGNEALNDRIATHGAYLTTVLQTANDSNQNVKVRTAALEQATKIHESLEAEGGEIESILSSKANLLQAQLTLSLEKSATKGEAPNVPPHVKSQLEHILNTSTSSDTKTLVTNLLANVESATNKAGQEYIKGINAKEVADFKSVDQENKIGLSTVEGDASIPFDQRDAIETTYISNIIMSLQQGRESNSVTDAGKVELQKEMLWWKNKLATKATQADILAAKHAKKQRELEEHTSTVNGIKEALKTGATVPAGSKEQRDQAANELVTDTLRTPANQEIPSEQLVDGALSDTAATSRLMYNLDNISTSTKIPILKRGMDAVVRRLVTEGEQVGSLKPWTDENKKAVQVLQTAYKAGGVLWNQLTDESKQRAVYLMSAINQGVDRSSAMRIVETPAQEGGTTQPDVQNWRGVVDALRLNTAGDNIQQQARGMYNYLAPKLGHDAAFAHTKQLTQFSHIDTPTLEIKYGKSFPTIEYKVTGTDGKEETVETNLEEMSKSFNKFTPEIKSYDVLGVKRVRSKSATNTLMQQLVGNSGRKDGTAISSFTEVDGFSAEVVGDTVVFHSNFGTSTLDKKKLSILAADLARGNKRYEEQLKQRRQRAASGGRLYNPDELQLNTK